MLDRLDLQIELPALTARELLAAGGGEPSAAVRERVTAVRERQWARGCLNARLPHATLREVCGLDAAGERLVADAVDRALRVARTIADLTAGPRVSATALAEALQYRAYEGSRPGRWMPASRPAGPW